MKEYIEREAAIEAVLGLTIVDPAVAQYANAVYYILQDFPAADVAPVVRCRECKHWLGENVCDLDCNHEMYTDPDDFCSKGEDKSVQT